MYGIVYRATNIINGKVYIGQTIGTLNRRMVCHISDALLKKDNMYFHKAIRKYGKENFIWEIIVECKSLKELNKSEIGMIEKYDTFSKGYNLTEGGEGVLGLWGEAAFWYGRHHTEESKKKMSEGKKGEKNYNYGKHPTKETREKMSKSSEGKKMSDSAREKVSKARKDKKHSKEHTEKLAKATSKKYKIITPEGDIIFIHGIVKFCKSYKKEKLNPGNLIKVAKGRQKYCKGYKCEYC